MHWATDLIGLPWQRGARGPEAFDCYGFFCYVQETYYGRRVPNIAPDTMRQQMRELSKARQEWVEVAKPQEGDAVLMSRARVPQHIGVWVGANRTFGVLHCVEGLGVVFTVPASLRAAGWGGLAFYRYQP